MLVSLRRMHVEKYYNYKRYVATPPFLPCSFLLWRELLSNPSRYNDTLIFEGNFSLPNFVIIAVVLFAVSLSAFPVQWWVGTRATSMSSVTFHSSAIFLNDHLNQMTCRRERIQEPRSILGHESHRSCFTFPNRLTLAQSERGLKMFYENWMSQNKRRNN